MSAPLVLAMPGNDAMARALVARLGGDYQEIEVRAFPDGETYLRLGSDPKGRTLVIVCTLDHPNDKLLALLFAAATARELGAATIGLAAPYLAYMRQDRRFKSGEAVTSREVAALISDAFDWLVTVDPHLHRYASLGDIYRIPTGVVHAAPLISDWIRTQVQDPLIIGPDSESEQWVAAVATDVQAPFTVLEKARHGDRDVTISVRNLRALGNRTPVLLDDIVSTGRTMLEAARHLESRSTRRPVCIAVHGLFVDHSDRLLADAGARVVTSNTVPHPSNGIDVVPLLEPAIRKTLDEAVQRVAGNRGSDSNDVLRIEKTTQK
jgi:ribose-phosphate pyrophosphokinase